MRFDAVSISYRNMVFNLVSKLRLVFNDSAVSAMIPLDNSGVSLAFISSITDGVVVRSMVPVVVGMGSIMEEDIWSMSSVFIILLDHLRHDGGDRKSVV